MVVEETKRDRELTVVDQGQVNLLEIQYWDKEQDADRCVDTNNVTIGKTFLNCCDEGWFWDISMSIIK